MNKTLRWILLATLGMLTLAAVYITSERREQSAQSTVKPSKNLDKPAESQPLDTPSTNESNTTDEKQVTSPATQAAPKASPSPKPELPPLHELLNNPLKPIDKTQHEGPQLPDKKIQLSPSEKRLLDIPTDSEDKGTELNYGYDGKEDDRYKLNLGVSQNGVSIDTKLNTDKKDVKIEGVEIKIDLPK